MVAVAGVAVAAVVVWVVAAAEVVARGHLVEDDPTYVVERVRLPGGSEVLVDPSRSLADVVGAVLLAAVAVVAYVRLRGAPAPSGAGARRLLAGLAAAGAFLAVDELFAVHESIGLNLGDAGPVEHMDDLVLAGYAALLGVWVWAHRAVWRGSRRARYAVRAALGLALAAAAFDVLQAPYRAEEGVESLAVVALVAFAGSTPSEGDRSRAR